jgi:hypothetical protein
VSGRPDVSLTWRGVPDVPDDPPPAQWPALYRAGASTVQIAAWTNHTPVRVNKTLREMGVVLRPGGARPRKDRYQP